MQLLTAAATACRFAQMKNMKNDEYKSNNDVRSDPVLHLSCSNVDLLRPAVLKGFHF